MPHFSGINADGIAVAGPITHANAAAFIESCQAMGWKRCAVTEARILASFNEHGLWLHPELEEVAS